MALSSRRHLVALLIALAADGLQWAILPLFGPGFASPANDALDVVVTLLMVALVGRHWAFLPAFLAELVPFVDLAPTWTLAWWIATRGRKQPPNTGFQPGH